MRQSVSGSGAGAARERQVVGREKAAHDCSRVVHAKQITTLDLVGLVALRGAVVLRHLELGGRSGCSKHNAQGNEP